MKHLFLSLLSICIFCISTTSAEKFTGTDGFIFLKNNITQQHNTTDLLRQTVFFTKQKSLAFQDTQLFFLGSQNQKFLFHSLQNTAPKNFEESITQNNITLKRLNSVDILEYLENEKNRKSALDKYIFITQAAEQENTYQHTTLSGQISSLQKQVKTQKKKVSSLNKQFSTLVKNKKNSTADIQRLQEEIVMESGALAQIQTQYQKLSALGKEHSNSLNILSNRIQAIEENYDALLKNVRVKSPSGKLIDVIVEQMN